MVKYINQKRSSPTLFNSSWSVKYWCFYNVQQENTAPDFLWCFKNSSFWNTLELLFNHCSPFFWGWYVLELPREFVMRHTITVLLNKLTKSWRMRRMEVTASGGHSSGEVCQPNAQNSMSVIKGKTDAGRRRVFSTLFSLQTLKFVLDTGLLVSC